MTDKELIKKLRTESLYKDKATLEIMDLCMRAADRVERLQSENTRLKAERDKAVEDLKMCNLINKSCYACKYADEKYLICTAPRRNKSCTIENHFVWRGMEESE